MNGTNNRLQEYDLSLKNLLGLNDSKYILLNTNLEQVTTGSCSHGGIHSAGPHIVKIDFSSSVNPLGVSRSAITKLKKCLRTLSCNYPDPECADFKENLIRYLDGRISIDQINVGNGATEIIHNFARSFVKKAVIIPSPTFCEYELASRRVGAKAKFVPLSDWEIDPDAILDSAKNIDAIFLCNPNNPTGILSNRSIYKILERSNDSTKILVDESFMELTDDPKAHLSLIDKVSEFPNMVILRSLTKSHGLAGLRLGYSISHPRTARQLSMHRIAWNVNGLAQVAGIIALNDTQHLRRAKNLIRKERKFMFQEIHRRLKSFSTIRSDVNFYLIDLHRGNSLKLRDYLLRWKGILVRDCSTFRGLRKNFIRVAIRNHHENVALLRSLESIDH